MQSFFDQIRMHKCMSLHGDFDHMGEASNLTKKFNVKKVIFNNDSYNELETSLLLKKNLK